MAFGQLSTNLIASNANLNQCGPITLTVIVSGGSGNYTYGWSATPSSGAIIEDVPSITVTPNTVTTFRCIVFDLNTGQASLSQTSVVPDLTGNFDVFIPNVFTPNGDGINDIWEIRDADVGFGPLNAYRYELTIVDRNGITVFSESQTITSGATGLQGGDITWDGIRNGSLLPNGVYYYSLRLINCNRNTNFQGNVTILGGSSLIASDEIVSIYPNPSNEFIKISINNKDDVESSVVKADVSPYEVIIHDKFGNSILSETIRNQNERIDISRLASDIYYLTGEYKGQYFQKRLVIED
jgi:gliding motility-associated-like protein